MPYLSPAEYVIIKFGGVRKTARILKRDPSAVCKWKKPRSMRGCGGEIPGLLWREIIEYATKNNIDVTLQDLYGGRTIVF